MEMKFKDNLEEPVWAKALASLSEGAELLQSFVWGKIVEADGLLCRRFAWEKDEKIIILAQVIESDKFGFKFWYLPRGPVSLTASVGTEPWQQVKKDLIARAKKNNIVSFVFEPENFSLPAESFGHKIKAIQPEKSLFLDLSLSEEELLKAMHHKTRYNIRLAEKKEVKIVPGQVADLKAFWKLLQTTTARDGFRGHSLAHYRHLLTEGAPPLELWLASRENKILAAGIFSFYNGRAVYLHGASANFGREYMAPYLLQWRMIQRAQKKACHYYDFYGIDEKKWPGVTRFKRGFGGEERNYPGTYLIIIRPFIYYLYKILATVKNFLSKSF
ncbi:aminoacyltransferase [Patescibacteria group bacterium]|nr:aminoacyltransferase [Patescibacteria group bacterium]